MTGDATTGGGHKFGFSRLFNGKTKFPASWSSDKIMNAVSDIATAPSLKWVQQTGKAGNWFTKAGKPARFTVEGTRNGTNIKVVLEPAGEGIITAFPIK
ncbi:EndoU domain-containing protein [Agarivorans sp. QJM3NY_25]|uniref:EndoU domain-containing protein n=1 Tax=Agarivorans sp. QJM3NY_25 TaxID=3421430 RepID=UPI003D7D9903